jgi:hypothetical protein
VERLLEQLRERRSERERDRELRGERRLMLRGGGPGGWKIMGKSWENHDLSRNSANWQV